MLGPDHVILTTDYFYESSPRPAEMLRMFVFTLADFIFRIPIAKGAQTGKFRLTGSAKGKVFILFNFVSSCPHFHKRASNPDTLAVISDVDLEALERRKQLRILPGKQENQ